MNYAIAIHGGAGAWDIRAKNIDEAVAACREAAAIGRTILRDGGSALDAVEQAAGSRRLPHPRRRARQLSEQAR